MSAKQSLANLLDQLSEERVREILDFARFVALEEERQEWTQFGREQFACAYGPDEPEYTADDIKPSADR